MDQLRAPLLAFAVMAWSTASAAPGLINYQGQLTDPTGDPITLSVEVIFSFYDAEAGGNQLDGFTDTDTVTPDAQGIYSTLVGDEDNLIPASLFAGDEVWLNVNIEGEDLMPRLRVASAGFAMQAGQADTATTADKATHATSADSATSAFSAAHATTADHAVHATSADTATSATFAFHSASAGTATNADDSDTLQGLEAADFLNMSADAFVIVKTTSSATQNATNLLAAYTTAKALTPNGTALSAANRATVIVPPGRYDLDGISFTLDTDFVDLIGLTSNRESQHVYNSNQVLVQTANDVRIENLLLHYTGASASIHAYFPNATWNSGANIGSPPRTRILNCEFKAAVRSMRTSVEYAGKYEDCVGGGSFAFGGSNGTASGTFNNCTGGSYAFGGFNGTASGTFNNCTGGNFAFGGSGGSTDGGVFSYCNGGSNSLPAGGTFLYCIRNGVAF